MTTHEQPDFYPTWIAQAEARKRAARRSRLMQAVHDLREAARDYEHSRIGKRLDRAADRIVLAIKEMAEREDGR